MSDLNFDTDDQLQAHMAKYAGRDAELLWLQTTEESGLQEAFAAVREEGGDLKIIRGWTSTSNVPSVSVDLDISAADLVGPIEWDRYPHGGFSSGQINANFERVFTDTIGGDVEILWKNVGATSLYLARAVKVGSDEELVIGSAKIDTRKRAIVAEVAYRAPLEDFAPKAPAYGR